MCFLKMACLTSVCIFIIWVSVLWAEITLMIESYFRFFSVTVVDTWVPGVDVRRGSTPAPPPLSVLTPFQVGARKQVDQAERGLRRALPREQTLALFLRLQVGIRTASVKNEALGSAKLLEVEGHPPRVTWMLPAGGLNHWCGLRACGGLWELDVRSGCWSLQNCFSEEEMHYK